MIIFLCTNNYLEYHDQNKLYYRRYCRRRVIILDGCKNVVFIVLNFGALFYKITDTINRAELILEMMQREHN